jgi:uncharacterized protein (DUF362 family)
MGDDMKPEAVMVVRSLEPGYGTGETASLAVRALLEAWGLDKERAGTAQWNPLGALIAPGARVVLKPNWVLEENRSGAGLDCLVTHPSIIEAVLGYVALARPAGVVIGDAPLQGCDLAALWRWCGIEKMLERFRACGLAVRAEDFRRTVRRGRAFGDRQDQDCRDRAAYVLFDLGTESLLEALSADAGRFRVTMYDPELLGRTHGPGRHQYLVAREVIEADVVVNLPKLKSHCKSCITGALKNIVGINGNKEYLPHHRKGGAGGGGGGDCYPGNSWLKRRAEDLLDAANRRPAGRRQQLLGRAAELAVCGAEWLGEDGNVEGSWHGNDTVWRTCLDLQRVLLYGRPDGTLAGVPQRKVITITDAILGGEGEGPLANTPVESGFVTGALDAAAAEWVHARLMGFDPRRIPLVREAFGKFPHPVTGLEPSEVVAVIDGEEVPAERVRPFEGRAFRPAEGWRGHCELEG